MALCLRAVVGGLPRAPSGLRQRSLSDSECVLTKFLCVDGDDVRVRSLAVIQEVNAQDVLLSYLATEAFSYSDILLIRATVGCG